MKLMVRIILSLIFLGNAICAFSSEPTKIADSNSEFATFYTNGQKIVRTSEDQLFVVFQDVEEKQPVIKYTMSSDLTNWSTPEIIGQGSMPALAIDEDDEIYAVWMKPDSSGLDLVYWDGNSWDDMMTIQVDSIETYHRPSIEYQYHSIHIVWQGRSKGSAVDAIYYAHLSLIDVQMLQTIMKLNNSDMIPEKPLIRGAIRFSEYLSPYSHVVILWVEYNSDRSESQVCYSIIFYRGYSYQIDYLPAKIIENSNLKYDPTISLDLGLFFLVLTKNSGMRLSYSVGFIEDEGFMFFDGGGEIITSQDPMPMLDDIRTYWEVALLWQDQNEIYYSQLTYEKWSTPEFEILPENPVQVNESNQNQKFYPNVCYRTFRKDYFDVIWTEENDNSYQIMHRRYDKIHKDLGILESGNSQLKSFKLYQNYPNPFNASTTINYNIPHAGKVKLSIFNTRGQEIANLFDGFQNIGAHQVVWQTEDLPSGVYFYRLATSESVLTKKLLLLK